MADKPSYLGLLNEIAASESRAYRLPSRLGRRHARPRAGGRLRTVAFREGEHGRTFARRINELGFEPDPTDEAAIASRVAIAGSDLPDHVKAEQLGVLSVSGTEKALRPSTTSSRTIRSTSAPASFSAASSPRSTTRCGFSRLLPGPSGPPGRSAPGTSRMT